MNERIYVTAKTPLKTIKNANPQTYFIIKLKPNDTDRLEKIIPLIPACTTFELDESLPESMHIAAAKLVPEGVGITTPATISQEGIKSMAQNIRANAALRFNKPSNLDPNECCQLLACAAAELGKNAILMLEDSLPELTLTIAAMVLPKERSILVVHSSTSDGMLSIAMNLQPGTRFGLFAPNLHLTMEQFQAVAASFQPDVTVKLPSFGDIPTHLLSGFVKALPSHIRKLDLLESNGKRLPEIARCIPSGIILAIESDSLEVIKAVAQSVPVGTVLDLGPDATIQAALAALDFLRDGARLAIDSKSPNFEKIKNKLKPQDRQKLIAHPFRGAASVEAEKASQQDPILEITETTPPEASLQLNPQDKIISQPAANSDKPLATESGSYHSKRPKLAAEKASSSRASPSHASSSQIPGTFYWPQPASVIPSNDLAATNLPPVGENNNIDNILPDEAIAEFLLSLGGNGM